MKRRIFNEKIDAVTTRLTATSAFALAYVPLSTECRMTPVLEAK